MIRFGIIGCGRISERHAGTIAKCAKASLIGLCDPREERMEELERRYASHGGLNSERSVAITKYREPDDLLRDELIDAVVVCTPSNFHAQWAIAALRAGKHVLLEKPMALSLRDCDRIIGLAETLRLRVQVCHQLRYRAPLALAKKWVDDGSLGTIRSASVSVRLNRSPAYYTTAPWRGSWEQDGGMLINQGVHLIDLLLWIMGESVDSVYGLLGWSGGSKQTEDVAAGTIRFSNGAVGTVEANTISQPDNLDQSISLFGDRGTINIGGAGLSEVRRWHAAGLEPPRFAEIDEHLALYDHFVGALLEAGGESFSEVTARDGRRSLETVFALYESARTGMPVRLPMTAFDTRMMNDIVKNGLPP